MNYYADFCKMSILNLTIKDNLQRMQHENEKLKTRVQELEKLRKSKEDLARQHQAQYQSMIPIH